MRGRGFSSFTLLMLLASGCDPGTGVVRTVQVKQLPSKEAIEAALSDVAEIKRFELHSVQDGNAYYYFTANDGGILHLKEIDKGVYILELNRMGLGSTPKVVADRTRDVIDKVYASLRKHSPDLPLPTNVVERLIRVRDK